MEDDSAFCPKCGTFTKKIEKNQTTVKVSARRIIKPQVCACCLGKAETSFVTNYTRLKGKRKVSVDISRDETFPLCSRCSFHIQKYNSRALPIVLGIIAFSIIWGIASSYSGWFWLLLIPDICFTVIWYNSIIKETHKLMNKDCAYEGKPVKYLTMYGSEHTFSFMNSGYAKEFIELNRNKIIW